MNAGWLSMTEPGQAFPDVSDMTADELKDFIEHVKRLYHPIENNRTHRGEMYMLGRKLIESGVRFVTINTQWPSDGKLWPGGGNMNWDHHDAIYSSSNTNIKGGGAGAGRDDPSSCCCRRARVPCPTAIAC